MKNVCKNCGKDASKTMFVKKDSQASHSVLVDLCGCCYAQDNISGILKNKIFSTLQEQESALHERMRAGRQEYDAKIRSKSQ